MNTSSEILLHLAEKKDWQHVYYSRLSLKITSSNVSVLTCHVFSRVRQKCVRIYRSSNVKQMTWKVVITHDIEDELRATFGYVWSWTTWELSNIKAKHLDRPLVDECRKSPSWTQWKQQLVYDYFFPQDDHLDQISFSKLFEFCSSFSEQPYEPRCLVMLHLVVATAQTTSDGWFMLLSYPQPTKIKQPAFKCDRGAGGQQAAWLWSDLSHCGGRILLSIPPQKNQFCLNLSTYYFSLQLICAF